jgi:hypothetical protein
VLLKGDLRVLGQVVRSLDQLGGELFDCLVEGGQQLVGSPCGLRDVGRQYPGSLLGLDRELAKEKRIDWLGSIRHLSVLTFGFVIHGMQLRCRVEPSEVKRGRQVATADSCCCGLVAVPQIVVVAGR